jgi:hypothetical protein
MISLFNSILIKSEPLIISNNKNLINNKINLFCQFFINKNIERHNEILYVLKRNVENPLIDKIYLLNEKIYTDEELDIKSNKIVQVNINRRLKFKDVFLFINNYNITGYNILANSDIFFDDTIQKLQYSDLHSKRKMCALSRYEFDINDANNSKPFIDGGSQDVWIIHSNNKLLSSEIEQFDFNFGKPGCDSHLAYLFYSFEYTVINDLLAIKSYHYHSSNFRTYNNKDKINGKYLYVIPYNIKLYKLIKITDVIKFLLVIFIFYIIYFYINIISINI